MLDSFEPLEPIFKPFKIGRNDPCPCGSMKKFKKCCGPKGVDVDSLIRDRLKDMVTSADLEPTSTQDIVLKLREIGVRSADQQSFTALAEGEHSSRRIYEAWHDELTRKPSFHEDSFLVAAAQTLWERWLPERIAVEQFSAWVSEGYELLDDGKTEEGLDQFWRAWGFLVSNFSSAMTTIDAAEEILEDTDVSLLNFLGDFESAFYWKVMRQAKYQDMAIAFCSKVLEQFSKEDSTNQEHIRLKLAEAYWCKGEEARAESIYREMIAVFPRRSAGYVGWSDMVGDVNKRLGRQPDYQRACEILRMAKDAQVKDGDDWDVYVRLSDYSKEVKA